MPMSTVNKAINDQVQMEFSAAYLYLSMSAYLDAQNLPGFAHWMRMQYEEELTHALKFFDYLLEKGVTVQLKEIAKPQTTFKGPLDCMKKSLGHEQKVTASIHKIYKLALERDDYTAQIMLQWFIDEQMEEEKTVGDVIAQLELVGDNGPAMLMMDRELGSRQAGQED